MAMQGDIQIRSGKGSKKWVVVGVEPYDLYHYLRGVMGMWEDMLETIKERFGESTPNLREDCEFKLAVVEGKIIIL